MINTTNIVLNILFNAIIFIGVLYPANLNSNDINI